LAIIDTTAELLGGGPRREAFPIADATPADATSAAV
jgi:hypothetical protein